ncbi:MAG: LEA14-like dessication related protein [Bacteroidia bacterium]|jgi:LEA14-like dessication related protein
MGGPKSPSFINLDNVKILSANARKVVLQGDAIFNNPNAIAGKLTKTDIHIKINDVDITDIEQTTSIDVPKNSNFTVPVNFSFNPKKLTQDNDGFLQNAIKSFLSNELTIEYAGYVTIEVLGIGFDVPIDYTEKVSLGLN